MLPGPDLARPLRLLLIVAFTINACDNGSADPSADIGETSNVPIQRLGAVWLNQQLGDGPRGTSIEANFALLNQPLGNERTIETVVPSPDLCSTDAITPSGFGAAFNIESDSTIEVEYISAGEALVFSSPAGTWHTLLQDPEPGDFGYVDSASLPPDELTLDVPGDSFPGFPDMPVANITPLENVTPEGLATLTSDSVFRWPPAPADANTLTVIFIEIAGPVFVSDASGDHDRRRFFCVARDDGELALRDAADDELSSLIDQDATLTRTSAWRSGYTTQQKEDALLVVIHSVLETVPEGDSQP